ncbi:N-acetylmuramoyl-L-alanine amidase [Brevibacterium daeguense]|nr:N-acetylmuramoyl-L-alanine amidase [Brevibacterium daeguense]
MTSLVAASVLIAPMAQAADPLPKLELPSYSGNVQPVDNSDAEVHRLTESAELGETVSVDLDATSVVGVTWDGDDPKSEYRVKIGGEWQAWEQMPVEDGAGPEPGSTEAEQAKDGTEPLAVTDAEQIEFRAENAKADTTDIRIEVFSTEKTSADVEIARDSGTEPAPTPSEPILPSPDAPTEDNELEERRAPELGSTSNNSYGETADTLAQPVAPDAASVYTAASTTGLGRYTSRAEWGANESKVRCSPSTASENRAVTIHHTAGSNSYSESEVPGILRGYLEYHTSGRGWCDLGYNMLVDKFGNIYEGRAGGFDKAVVGAHAGGFNTGTFGVSVMGTYSSSPSTAALDALEKIIAWQSATWGYDPTAKVTLTSGGSTRYASGQKVSLHRVFGHRDVSTTECPGNGLYDKLSSLRSEGKKQQDSVLPFDVPGPIGAHYRAIDGTNVLGMPTSSQHGGLRNGGRYQSFERGDIHWSESFGAHSTQAGPIRNLWKAQKFENGRLGYPKTEQHGGLRNDGSYQSFEGGDVHWSDATGAHATWGDIRVTWGAHGYENGKLGYPTSREHDGLRNGGAYQSFQGGDIHWTSATGAHATWGGIRTEWARTGFENGSLGYPTSREHQLRDRGAYQSFEEGDIHYSPATGANATRGAIRETWGDTGYENGKLGYPKTREHTGLHKGGAYQGFQGGDIHWSPDTGAHATWGGIRSAWGKTGWEKGKLGYPTSNEYKKNGVTRQDFQGGYIEWRDSKAHVVYR